MKKKKFKFKLRVLYFKSVRVMQPFLERLQQLYNIVDTAIKHRNNTFIVKLKYV